jgi:hypothetical protein
MKLFVDHFITIAAFCHVVNVRKERILGSKFALYLLIPSTFLLAHVLAFLLLTAGAVSWLLFNRPRRLGESLKRPPWLFLGSAPVYEDASEAGREDEERELLLKIGGRFLGACAFLTQCSGTVALFLRRQKHHAVTWAEIRILEVACTGILTAIYWMLIAARVPAYVQPILAVSDDDKTDLDEVLLWLRGYNPAPAQHMWATRVIRFLRNYYLCVFALIIKLVYVPDADPPKKTKIIGFNITTIILRWINYFLPFAMMIGGYIIAIRYLFGEPPVPAGWCPTSRSATGFLIFFLFSQSMAPVVLYYLVMEWKQIANQLHELEGWSADKACPLLWSDPAANWIWAIG